MVVVVAAVVAVAAVAVVVMADLHLPKNLVPRIGAPRWCEWLEDRPAAG